jgi:methylphosphotriester-DNA--protein-cysteine methyltransferase
MIRHSEIENEALRKKIRHKEVLFAGNRKLKISGTLDGQSGKRMKRQNRVFFESLSESQNAGYRPCGHGMRKEYRKWIC